MRLLDDFNIDRDPIFPNTNTFVIGSGDESPSFVNKENGVDGLGEEW